MSIILQCPVCRNPLLNSADGYQCSRNHTFDSSREGYVNLLLVHKKNSKEPGDSKDMVRCRTRFLDRGLYNAVSDGINDAVAAHLTDNAHERTHNLLDAGCGEGFYLKRLKEFLATRPGNAVPAEYYGVDISKFAVRQATRRDRTMNWFVSGIKNLPFAPCSFDAVLNVFSPAHIPEFSRVLADSGFLLTVTPGPKHLNGLRELIYPNAREHGSTTLGSEAQELLALAEEKRINYPVELAAREAIMDLLSMTPYFWNIDLKTKAKVEACDRLALDVDVMIRIYRKRTPC